MSSVQVTEGQIVGALSTVSCHVARWDIHVDARPQRALLCVTRGVGHPRPRSPTVVPPVALSPWRPPFPRLAEPASCSSAS